MRKSVSLLALFFLTSCLGSSDKGGSSVPSVNHPKSNGSKPVREKTDKDKPNPSVVLPKGSFVDRILAEPPVEDAPKDIKASDLLATTDNSMMATRFVSNSPDGTGSLHQVRFGGNSLGLTYSDFGYWRKSNLSRDLNGNLTESAPIDKMFAGGDSDYLFTDLSKENVDNIEFTGKAYAAITEKNTNQTKKFVTGGAKLTFDPGTQNQSLNVTFDNKWYNMTLDINASTDKVTAKFVKPSGFVDNGYTFANTAENATEGKFSDGKIFNSTLFGKFKAIEAVGTFDIQRSNEAYGLHGAFGAKRSN